MSDTNVFVCTGRLGRDPEKRTFNNGDSVVNFNVAVGEQWKSRDTGEKQERTLWLNVSVQNQGIAKVAEQYLKKGSRVSIAGKLQSREYEKDGQKHTVIELVISPFGGSLTMLDGPSGDSQQRQQERQPARSASAQAPAFAGLDDDIPFIMEWR
jgi:single-strand DNA-binding protein